MKRTFFIACLTSALLSLPAFAVAAHPEAASASVTTPAQQSEVAGSILRGNKNTKVFHNIKCQYYTSKNCTVEFRTAQEALAKGYKACKRCGS